ncbi:MAG TPA: hypothetical protein VH561_09900 [Micromonosporaceae bacterium]
MDHAGEIADPIGRLAGTPYDRDAGRRTGQPAYDEDERTRARVIQPLRVIDGDQHGSMRRKRTDGGSGREVQGEETELGVRLFPTQDHPDHPGLRAGQRLDHLVGQADEQLDQADVGQVHLRRRRPAGQHDRTPLRRPVEKIVEQGRLPNPRLAFDQQHTGFARRVAHESLKDRPLFGPADNRMRQRGLISPVPTRPAWHMHDTRGRDHSITRGWRPRFIKHLDVWIRVDEHNRQGPQGESGHLRQAAALSSSAQSLIDR